MIASQTVVNGRGDAYKSQSLAESSSLNVPFLWQERPIPFLENAQLLATLLRANVTRVLDAGCGDARNSLALAREGFCFWEWTCAHGLRWPARDRFGVHTAGSFSRPTISPISMSRVRSICCRIPHS